MRITSCDPDTALTTCLEHQKIWQTNHRFAVPFPTSVAGGENLGRRPSVVNRKNSEFGVVLLKERETARESTPLTPVLYRLANTYRQNTWTKIFVDGLFDVVRRPTGRVLEKSYAAYVPVVAKIKPMLHPLRNVDHVATLNGYAKNRSTLGMKMKKSPFLPP